MAKPFHLGLTGGIGSGKSTAAALLAKLGAVIVDADAIARSLTAPGGLAIAAIAQQFGPEFINTDGAMDRDRMRTLAFSDPDAKKRLEAIIHPGVAEETRRQAQAAHDAGRDCVVFDLPLLVESSRWRQQVDHVLVVDCLEETQITRVMARNGLPRSTVETIMASQSKRQRRLQVADSVIYNDGLSLQGLSAEVAALAPRFKLSLAPAT